MKILELQALPAANPGEERMKLETASDEELYRGVRGGEERAFTELYRRRQGQLFRFALQMSGSEAIAEDVTQDAFLAVMRDSAGFDPAKGPFVAWLYGIARNLTLRAIERRARHLPIMEERTAPDDPLGALTRGERLENLREAVLALPTHYREVVALCDLHEMSYADAAAALGCPEGTVRSRLHRARGFLLEKLRCLA